MAFGLTRFWWLKLRLPRLHNVQNNRGYVKLCVYILGVVLANNTFSVFPSVERRLFLVEVPLMYIRARGSCVRTEADGGFRMALHKTLSFKSAFPMFVPSLSW
jgi:hypothetical protein